MLTCDPAHSALLLMDFQTDIVSRYPEISPAVDRAATLLAGARAAKATVIFVVVGFRPGYPELDTRNPIFGALAQTGRLQTTQPGSDIDLRVVPASNEPVVLKHRVGPFHGTDLDQILRARRIDTLVLAGISTSGVVLSTVRYAADLDYKLVVVADACGDGDPEVHRLLTEKVFVRQATVVHTADVPWPKKNSR